MFLYADARRRRLATPTFDTAKRSVLSEELSEYCVNPERIKALRGIEWAIFGLKTRERWGLQGYFAFFRV